MGKNFPVGNAEKFPCSKSATWTKMKTSKSVYGEAKYSVSVMYFILLQLRLNCPSKSCRECSAFGTRILQLLANLEYVSK